MLLALALALTGLSLVAEEEPDEAALLVGLAQLEAPIAAGDWDRAREHLRALIEKHRGLPHGLIHLPELEAAVRAVEFGARYREREFADLVSGELLHYRRATRVIEVRYTPQTMGDFDEVEGESEGESLLVHPAVFDGDYRVTLSGPSFPDRGMRERMEREKALTLLPLPRPCVYLGLGDASFSRISCGHARGWVDATEERPAHSAFPGQSLVWELLSLAEGRESLERLPDAPFVPAEPFALRIEVDGRKVSMYSQREKLMSQRLGAEALGRVGFSELPEFEELTLKGRVEPSWFQRLRDADREQQRADFDASFDLEAVLAGWYPMPDVESFGFGELSPGGQPRAARDIRRVLGRVRVGRHDAALELLAVALEDEPRRADAWFEQTRILIALGLREDALESMRGAVESGAYTSELHELNSLVLRARRGPDWPQVFEARSEHYVVQSDIDKRVCVEAARLLEASYERFSYRLGDVEMGDQLFRVFLFAGEAGYEHYARGVLGEAPENTAGVYSPRLEQLLIWSTPERSEMMQTIRHEGFHQYFDRLVGEAPRWLNEGLAEYYESADFTKGRSRQIQTHPEHLLTLAARRGRLVDLRGFVNQSAGEFYSDADAHYAQAWLLVHFLQHSGRRERELFEALVGALVEGGESGEVLEGVFEGVDVRALERDLRGHLIELLKD